MLRGHLDSYPEKRIERTLTRNGLFSYLLFSIGKLILTLVTSSIRPIQFRGSPLFISSMRMILVEDHAGLMISIILMIKFAPGENLANLPSDEH